MATLLHIDSSPLPTSVSWELTRAFSKAWVAAHPDGRVIHRDLAAKPPQPIDATWVQGAYTPENERQTTQTAALAQSDQLIHELEQADEYVIGVAMHNFSIPSVLKLWIDQVVRYGRTFAYGQNGPQGLVKEKKVSIVVASGGVYEPGTAANALDFIEPYLRTIFGFIGITDLTFVKVGGTARLNSGAIAREALLEAALQRVRTIAA